MEGIIAWVTDAQIDKLRHQGLTHKVMVQLTHLVSDFSSYDTLNLALNTDHDYRDLWKELAGFTASADVLTPSNPHATLGCWYGVACEAVPEIKCPSDPLSQH